MGTGVNPRSLTHSRLSASQHRAAPRDNDVAPPQRSWPDRMGECRYLPEDGDGHDVILGIQAMPRNVTQLNDVQHAHHNHGEDGNDKADAHPLQLHEPMGPPNIGAHDGHDDAVLDRDPDDDTDGVVMVSTMESRW